MFVVNLKSKIRLKNCKYPEIQTSILGPDERTLSTQLIIMSNLDTKAAPISANSLNGQVLKYV